MQRQCLMDEAAGIIQSLQCPSCSAGICNQSPGSSSSSSVDPAEINVAYTNEGGLQPELGIMQSLKEEAYVQCHPEAVPARAFALMCTEGDIEGLLELLIHASQEDIDVGTIVRYQDPLSNMNSALHLAVEEGHEEVTWLLLWLSSTLASESFPEEVVNTAKSIGLGRLETDRSKDLRMAQDAAGSTAADVASRGDKLLSLCSTGILTVE